MGPNRMSTSTSSFKRYIRSVILIAMLVMALTAISFVSATEILIRTKVIPNDIFTWHLERFLSGNSQNVVFGDSHTSYGIRLPGFQNLSYPEDKVLIMELKVFNYFADIQPGRVIIQAENYAFAPGQQSVPPRTADLFTTKDSRFHLWMFTDLHKDFIGDYWKLLFNGGFKNTFTPRPNGGLTRVEKFSWQDEIYSIRVEQVEGYVAGAGRRPGNAPEETRSAGSYHRMLEFLTSRGAEVCLAGMPLPRLLTNSMREIPEFQLSVDFFETLAAQYRIRYVDLSEAIADTTLFLEAEHLNETGAEEFCPLLEAACFRATQSNQPSS